MYIQAQISIEELKAQLKLHHNHHMRENDGPTGDDASGFRNLPHGTGDSGSGGGGTVGNRRNGKGGIGNAHQRRTLAIHMIYSRAVGSQANAMRRALYRWHTMALRRSCIYQFSIHHSIVPFTHSFIRSCAMRL